MCVEATGGKCELLNTPGSSPLESLSHDTAIVLAPPLTDLPKSSMVWVSKVQRFLERWVCAVGVGYLEERLASTSIRSKFLTSHVQCKATN